MLTTSIKKGFNVPVLRQDIEETEDYTADDSSATPKRGSALEMLTLGGWRRHLLETLVLLAVIVVSQRQWFGDGEIPGLPHPYWLAVLLAACQYGVKGGTIAAVAASAVYFFDLSPASAAQDFYAYSRTVAIQPASWLATALVVGGLRNLHIHQYLELADQLALSRTRATDLCSGLERATAEINALERRVAVDMGSVAALSRGLSLIDLSDRRAAAASFGELFRIGAGAGSFTIYLKIADRYAPVWAVEDDNPRSTKSVEPLPSTTIAWMILESARGGLANQVVASLPGSARGYVVVIPSSNRGAEPLAAIVCQLHTSQDLGLFLRRAGELGRMFATILMACPNPTSDAR